MQEPLFSVVKSTPVNFKLNPLCRPLSIFALLSIVYSSLAHADTAIETETAQIGRNGDIAFSQSYEYGHAKDGSTSGATLTQFSYGLSDNAELLIEPFFYVSDHPKDESRVEGLGDLEVTPSYEFLHEDGWVPAVLAAFKLKVPTGSEKAGSSGQFDYLPYFIIGQHIAGWTLNANVGVNLVTSSKENDVQSQSTHTWALEAEREFLPNLVAFLEGFSTEDHVKTASTALEYEWTEHFNTFAAVGYTHDDEVIFRVGFNLEFGSDTAEP